MAKMRSTQIEFLRIAVAELGTAEDSAREQEYAARHFGQRDAYRRLLVSVADIEKKARGIKRFLTTLEPWE